MDRIARASTGERRLVFEAAAQRMALAPAVVEKDFWVCYTLDHLFHRSGFAESMVFKGGTSLSKAFGLIERFSEDIDLILDWRLLGYGEDEPWEPRSNSAQERFKADSIERTNAFLADAFVPKLRATLSESLGTEASVRCGAEEETVYFDYPRSYESAGTLDTIKLEIGPMAAWSPSEEAAITPYAADVVPFGPELSTTVRTASPERTFWEKATILHQEANRPEGKAMPRRYSRHYYDMYRLGHSFVLGRAVAQPGLLEQVVRFKEKFYRTPWAKLADARPGTLRLAPPKGRLDELAADYASMRPMRSAHFSLINLRVDWQHLFGRFREGQPRLPELDRRNAARRRVDPEVVVPVHVVRELGPELARRAERLAVDELGLQYPVGRLVDGVVVGAALCRQRPLYAEGLERQVDLGVVELAATVHVEDLDVRDGEGGRRERRPDQPGVLPHDAADLVPADGDARPLERRLYLARAVAALTGGVGRDHGRRGGVRRSGPVGSRAHGAERRPRDAEEPALR